jgi:predicted Zn-dependent protease
MLMNKDEACRIGEKVLKLTTADDVVVNIGHSREALTRLANNSIVHNVFSERREVTVSVAFGNQKGSASCDAIDDDSVKAMIERAEQVAKITPPDPEYLPSLGPQTYLPVEAHFDSTANLDADGRAKLAIELIKPAKAADYRLAGTVEVSESAACVMTKNGLFAYHPRTDAQVGCTVTAPDSTGWARDVTVDISLIKASELAHAAVEQARKAAHPKAMEPGKYQVVLMPAASGHLAEYLIWMANARMTKEGLTYLSDRLGKKLAGDDITIYSDPTDPRLPSCPFDGEGVPRTKLKWVDKGVFNQMHWDRWTAKQNGVEPVPHPGTPIMVGTDKSANDLIATVERGILVTHFWYVRSVKDDETLVTGMTRDGTFLIEDGKIKHGVKNMRFNQTCLGMLEQTRMIGKPGSCADVELMPSLFPALVVDDWNFVASTDF